ncbi:MAG: S1 family peptidase [Verrucomicrobiales bacterium]
MKTLALVSRWGQMCCAFAISLSSALALPQQWGLHSSKIRGGQEAQRGAWPWMAALVNRTATDLYNDHSCAGVLIAPYWVVTAAHCVYGESSATLDVVIGVHNLQTDTTYQRRHIREIIRHPDFSETTGFGSDIALLLLEQPVPTVSPLEIIDDPALALPGVMATILGWGATDGAGNVYPSVLQTAQVPIVSLEVANAPEVHDGTLTATMLPAGFAQGGVDACAGDSGGPLLVRDVDGQRWMLAGVTSFGKADAFCGAPNNYGVYTRVSSFRSWLYSFMRPRYGAWETANGVSGEMRDPDGDRSSNWLEFARGTPPFDGRDTGIEAVTTVALNGERVPEFLFRRRIAPEMSYSAHFSLDGFSGWQPLALQEVISTAEEFDEVVVRAPIPLGNANRVGFFRVAAAASHQFIKQNRELGFPGYVSHALHDLDATSGNSFVKSYLLRDLETVQGAVTLNLRSTAFDAAVQLFNADTAELVTLSNANNAGGSNELLVFTPDPGTNYLAAVTSSEPQRSGDFLLALYQPPTGLPTLVPNIPRQGSLTIQDPLNPLAGIPGVYKDDFVPSGAVESQQVTVSLTSNSFAPFVHIVDVATNESAFGGSAWPNESVVSFLWPIDRSLLVRATSQEPNAVGNYSVSMTVRTLPTMTPSQTRNGALASTDERDPYFLPDIYYLDSYLLTGTMPGRTINVEASSNAIDCYLYVVDAQTGELIAQNDDISFSNTNSRLNFMVEAGVTYLIQVSSAIPEEQGSYTVRTY